MDSENNIKGFYIPEELLLEIGRSGTRFTIGIPCERQEGEKRIILTPEAVEELTSRGYQVIMEKGAGSGINYSDTRYADAGAFIVQTPQEVFQADLILKISPPLVTEVNMMKAKTILLSFVQFNEFSQEAFQLMMAKRITALSYEFLSDEHHHSSVMNIISEIEGCMAVTLAADMLSNQHGGKGILLGGIPGVTPTEIIIIGAGNSGTVIARAAMALGASVKVFDDDISKLRTIQQALGSSLFTSTFHPSTLHKAFKSADVVIGAMRYINVSSRYVVSEDLVKIMKNGSVIIDLRIGQGGCFETSCGLSSVHPHVFEEHGVLHYCKPNISNLVARTTSIALSNLFVPFITRLGNLGNLSSIIKGDICFRNGLYMYCGKPVNPYISNHFHLSSNNIDIYLSPF